MISLISLAARTAFPILLLALAACSSANQPEPNPNVPPVNYKAEILVTIQKLLSDPANVKDAGITDPALRPAGQEQRYAVCVRSNARDFDRNYQGIKYHLAWFHGGHLNQLIDATPEQCANAPYKPFPELEKLCLAEKCA